MSWSRRYAPSLNLLAALAVGGCAAPVDEASGSSASTHATDDTCAIPGDLDGDGAVAFADFLTLSENFGEPGTPSMGDIDGDGVVGFGDHLILSAHFGWTEATHCVEPTFDEALLEDDEGEDLPSASIGYYLRAPSATSESSVTMEIYQRDGVSLGRFEHSADATGRRGAYVSSDGHRLGRQSGVEEGTTALQITQGGRTVSVTQDSDESELADMLMADPELGAALMHFGSVDTDPASALAEGAAAGGDPGVGGPVPDNDAQRLAQTCGHYERISWEKWEMGLAYMAIAAAYQIAALRSSNPVSALIYISLAAAAVKVASAYFEESARYWEKFLCCMHWRVGSFEGVACGCDGGYARGVGTGLSHYDTFGRGEIRFNKPGDRVIGACSGQSGVCVRVCEPTGTDHDYTDPEAAEDWRDLEHCPHNHRQCSSETLARDPSCSCSNAEEPGCAIGESGPIWAVCGT